ncbi:Ribosomal RNA small subunit methyltransferase G [Propionispora sp. 2/2-37]|uniref:16S rRNA (guanine(527)-N(7))-methyltransferase RsmG n=1 Tax=Propionispora sp. 2/2-37 TaxID=1677858 RepID=UPI0006BB9182|nr:16S rRNA (guanine(527)-N(7))-methyltransferase RsmG [Propionispora sp. 2/2-37]CUH95774.1 Ribosomal RNA small subunit methyltransferase G [Propionispora sp. 2/2-37]
MFTAHLLQAAKEYGVALTEHQAKQFAEYYALLITWNEKINLTAITEPREVAVKHMIDSLSCYHEAYFPRGSKIIDVGTGAGFPGLPLKIIRPDITLTLLDSLQKRLNFLQEVVQKLALQDVRLLHARAEDAGKKLEREQHDVALSRAVARLNVLSELCLPMVKPGGYFVALKGAQYLQEIKEGQSAVSLLGGRIEEVKPVSLPGLQDVRAVIYIRKITATPVQYPRKAGTPEKKPL